MSAEPSPLVRLFVLVSLGASAVGIFAHTKFMAQHAPRLPVRVAASAELRGALAELRQVFEEEHAGLRVELTFGPSWKLYSQILSAGPFDVFLAADEHYPRRLREVHVATAENTFAFAAGRLVVWAPREAALPLEREGVRALLAPGVRKVALADPKFDPYGKAAQAALEKLGVFGQLKDKLVFGDDSVQAGELAKSGAADAALLSRAVALSAAYRERGDHWPVPDEACPPLRQVGVILDSAHFPPNAQAWRDCLTSPRGQAILRDHGFTAE